MFEWDGTSLMMPGRIMDISTYRGNFIFLLFAIIATYFMWHLNEFWAWFDGLFGIEHKATPVRHSLAPTWSQLWALIIGGSGIYVSIQRMIRIAIKRHRARKTDGQWYDHPMTREELYGKTPPNHPSPETDDPSKAD